MRSMNAISALWQQAACTFGHSEHTVPAPWHAHIVVLSTAELRLQTRFPQSASYYTSDTAYRLCYAEPFVNSFVFPSGILLTFTRHHCVEGECDMLQPNRQSASCAVPSALTNPGNSVRSPDAWGRRGEAPTQVTQFGTCTNSSCHLQFPHQWSWGRKKGEEPLCVYLTTCITTIHCIYTF